MSSFCREGSGDGAVLAARYRDGTVAGGAVTSGLSYATLSAGLLEAVKYHLLEQDRHALYEVGGEYRRNM